MLFLQEKDEFFMFFYGVDFVIVKEVVKLFGFIVYMDVFIRSPRVCTKLYVYRQTVPYDLQLNS